LSERRPRDAAPLNPRNIRPPPQGEEADARWRDPAAVVTTRALPNVTPTGKGEEDEKVGLVAALLGRLSCHLT
jgi:hypothetical protein